MCYSVNEDDMKEPVNSVIPTPFLVNDPLVAIVGIGKYKPSVASDLPGVRKDYDNVINTFISPQ